MHLLDVTMLYAPTSGGVVRYLRAKRAWLRRHTSVRHSMLVPGDADGAGPAGERYLRTASLRPDGHRWPFAAHRWVREIRAAHPDARSAIVGRNPTDAVKALGKQDDVIVTGGLKEGDVVTLESPADAAKRAKKKL